MAIRADVDSASEAEEARGGDEVISALFCTQNVRMPYMMHLSKSTEDTKEIARNFLESIEAGDSAAVVALKGDLGAGKTAFSQAVGEILGVKENMHSPTFVILKAYSIDWKGFKNLVHIDAYRLERESELLHLGWEEIIKEPENLVLIEWPENVQGIIPQNAKEVSLKFVDERTREIYFDKSQ
jgi:tRNA threonylcarbamoyladenosine biosynthesis protein TsaE